MELSPVLLIEKPVACQFPTIGSTCITAIANAAVKSQADTLKFLPNLSRERFADAHKRSIVKHECVPFVIEKSVEAVEE